MGFGVEGLGFGFGVWGLGSGVWGLRFGVWGLGFGEDIALVGGREIHHLLLLYYSQV